MNEQKSKKARTHPINYILLAASLIVFGTLGLVFITQMELQPGWLWEEVREENSMEISILEADDLNNEKDGFLDAIAYSDVTRQDDRRSDDPNDLPNYGKIFALDGLTGVKIWEKDCENPVKRVFEVMDVNEDGYKDYFADVASVGPDWVINPNPGNDDLQPEIFLNDFSNILICGNNGTDIPILTGDHRSFTNFFVHDLVYLDGLNDNKPDIVFLECENKTSEAGDYYYNISSYFVNGTKFSTLYIDFAWIWKESGIPALQLFPYDSQEHLLFLDKNKIMLLNTSASNFLDPIYNETVMDSTIDYTITEDLNGDSIPEIIVTTNEGNISIINGNNGHIIRMFNLPRELEYRNYKIETINSNPSDLEAFIIISSDYGEEGISWREAQVLIYTVTGTSETLFRPYSDRSDDELMKVFTLGEDMDGDSVDEIVIFEKIRPYYSTTEVRRFSIFNIITNKALAVMNVDQGGQQLISFQDISGDGKKDFLFSSDEIVAALASSKPEALWQSPHFPLGFPLFIILISILCIGVFLVILKSRQLSYSRKKIKEHKLTVVVNVATITLVSITFLLFLIQLNIFNNTLIPNQNMTNIVISFLTVLITWYGTLPLTAALYNRFAPRFAYTFVKLRSMFFKISKSYNTDILIVDMKDRKEIGTIIQLKRVILPLMLSIAIGFYAYGLLTPILGYPQEFEVFGSTEFFQFMNGYMLCCIFPMILTFLVFSFFISGNFLLDDAGVVYFRQSKKYRQPGDIEPISIWAQSIVKGIAGTSAIITLAGFLFTVDFSGFFQDQESVTGMIMMFLIILVFFVGIPFLTSFSYILLAGEVMEFSMDFNTQKLYSIMEKKGYDTTPRDITNMYPEGFQKVKESITDGQKS
ncbi:MAG: hypothetical protein HWN80_19095 [Candidatus Lokiarchaeota archaeon]|nr:hypothetical protein [Candidatus Lokiarchaeota archaeon]